MEIELKYTLKSEKQEEEILKSKLIQDYVIPESGRSIRMEAIYFDTEDYDFSDNKVIFRLRSEGADEFATVKLKGSAENGLHEREEINAKLKVGTISSLKITNKGIERTKELFSHIGEKNIEDYLFELSKGKKLYPVIKMSFQRTLVLVKNDDFKAEVAFDSGFSYCKDTKSRILEMEIELKEGEKDGMIEFSGKIKDEFGLKEENLSKVEQIL